LDFARPWFSFLDQRAQGAGIAQPPTTIAAGLLDADQCRQTVNGLEGNLHALRQGGVNDKPSGV
jgi:hypothetical protein